MGEITYFLDTYAFIGLLEGKKAYDKFKGVVSVITTKMNLLELYYYLIRTGNSKKADFYFDFFSSYCIDVSDSVFKEAAKFKFKNKSKNISYVDAIGYVLARSKGLMFVTGDKEFKDLDGVNFLR
ncbi:PIN domain-containing protein [Candidatus Woesearchaeota archaeon]|nr:PIN domain-containing protein [Candidatus Woesearchaeota archaeon]